MTLMALFIAFAPLVWAKLCVMRWRSGSYRGLLIGGVAVGFAGTMVLVTGAVLQSGVWLSPHAEAIDGNLVWLGFFWVTEAVFMAVAGVVILLTFGPTDRQR